MDRAEIASNLSALGEKLAARSLVGEILLLGGAYMLLVIRSREMTKDVDAYLVQEREAIREAAREVAMERGLPEDWLNDAVSGFIYSQPDITLWQEYPGLRVYTPSPEYVFAMKAAAARIETSDLADLRALREKLGLRSLDSALAVVERYIPARLRTPKTQLVLEALFEDGADG